MNDIIVLQKVNEVYLKVRCSKSQAMELKEHMAFYASDYKYHPRFKAGFWDGKLYLYDYKLNLLPIGALPKFVTFCETFKYEYLFDFDAEKEFGDSIKDETLERSFEYLFPPEQDYYPRDYQQEAIKKALLNKRGVLRLATGAGKSIIIYTLIRMLIAKGEKIILVVPSISLVEQMFSDFKEYGWDMADKHCNLLYSGQQIDPRKSVLITTWQSVYQKAPKFFEPYGALIIDETHGAKGQSIQEICKKCTSASYRIGLTGTMPKDEAEKWTIYGFLGPTIYDLSAKTLIDRGVLSQIQIKNVIAKYPVEMCKPMIDYPSEQNLINGYEKRTKVLDHILKQIPKGQNTLILVQRIKHLKMIRDHLLDNHQNLEVYEIYGDTKPEERERIRKLVDQRDDVALICSYATMAVGVSIKKLTNVVFFESYKSEVKVLQSIGRGLRKHESKECMILWDVVDDLRYPKGKKMISNFTYRHWENFRLSYYKEQGFEFSDETINI